MPTESLTFGYLNHAGSYAIRTIEHPTFLFGATQWHKQPQWLVTGHCTKHDARRDFAQVDMVDPALADYAGRVQYDAMNVLNGGTRPAWDALSPAHPGDAAMKQHAIEQGFSTARLLYQQPPIHP